uniref:ARAD1D50820p n=1 Tax=Blastobotrys adeninivorans TaxID=409370 RepID=A0A060TIZ1_BLAAD
MVRAHRAQRGCAPDSAMRQCLQISPQFKLEQHRKLSLTKKMSNLTYYSYDGVGKRNLETFGYNQAVRVGDRIECSGQGGWDPKTGEIYREINQQIDQAFANVDLALRDAGGKGWDQVFRVNSYHIPLNDEALEAMTRNFKKWMPNHKPLWTCVGVTRLGADDMRVEIEVSAFDPK